MGVADAVELRRALNARLPGIADLLCRVAGAVGIRKADHAVTPGGVADREVGLDSRAVGVRVAGPLTQGAGVAAEAAARAVGLHNTGADPQPTQAERAIRVAGAVGVRSALNAGVRISGAGGRPGEWQSASVWQATEVPDELELDTPLELDTAFELDTPLELDAPLELDGPLVPDVAPVLPSPALVSPEVLLLLQPVPARATLRGNVAMTAATPFQLL